MELGINPKKKNLNNSWNLALKSFRSLNSEKLPISTLTISKKSKDFVNNLLRKYSYDPKLYIKNFVPVLHPMQNDSKLIPSRLILSNKKKSSSLSNPSSDDENEEEKGDDELNLSNNFVNSFISDSSSDSENDENNQISQARKNFSKIRKCSMYREKNLTPRKISSDNPIHYKENLCVNINHNIKDLDNSLQNIKEMNLPGLKNNINFINNDLRKMKRDRINSFSILETLQNNIKIDINLE